MVTAVDPAAGRSSSVQEGEMKSMVSNFQPHVDWSERPDTDPPPAAPPRGWARNHCGASLRRDPGGFFVLRAESFEQAIAVTRCYTARAQAAGLLAA
jgi:hypothetical protein